MAEDEIKDAKVEELKTEEEPEPEPTPEPTPEPEPQPEPGPEKPAVEEPPVAVEKGTATKEQIEEIKGGKYYTIKELAAELRYSQTWIYNLVVSGRIKAVKPTGGTWRIPPSEVERVKTEGIPPMPREKPAVEATEIVIAPEHVEKVSPPKPKEEKPGKVDIIKYLFGKE